MMTSAGSYGNGFSGHRCQSIIGGGAERRARPDNSYPQEPHA